ncbi:MAG TPA: polysaccharide biosynthesis C-terminal domain-containing protein [Xanthobacteraceae bacterium]|nr:polysaccharide biosynthesis C-terminal domain-containing protein [Xanthobacteraceae bacterium]
MVEQIAINFAANVFSAALGLFNVIVFTRLFAPAEFGTYVLGAGFAVILSTFLCSWLRLPIMREQARGDGTDVRGVIVPGLLASALLAPLAYPAARAVGLASGPAWAAVALALAIGLFETSQELLRSKLAAFTVMKATVARALLVPALGAAFALGGPTGLLLLASSMLAYLLAALAFIRPIWSGTRITFDAARLLRYAKAGMPLTFSLTLLALSSVIDRFIIAHLVGATGAGQYSPGVDLVRQALIIPAVSASAAFVPMAVKILANHGRAAATVHLAECFEFLMAITLPACIGFALVSSHIANVMLGPEFRGVGANVMPIVCIAVVFQIICCQYLHISFLLSERNSFYLLNTGSVLAFNAAVSYVLIEHYGMVGAAWGRLAAEMFGFLGALALTRWAFPVPLPLGRLARILLAAAAMAVAVKGMEAILPMSDANALMLLVPTGMASYGGLCWIMDIAEMRSRLAGSFKTVRGRLSPAMRPSNAK